MTCYMNIKTFISKKNNIMSNAYVSSLYVFFFHKKVKATLNSSAINKKLIGLVNIQIRSEKKVLCNENHYFFK